jgi:hypothetical protein
MYKTSENRNPLKTGLLVKSGPVFRVFTVHVCEETLDLWGLSLDNDFTNVTKIKEQDPKLALWINKSNSVQTE